MRKTDRLGDQTKRKTTRQTDRRLFSNFISRIWSALGRSNYIYKVGEKDNRALKFYRRFDFSSGTNFRIYGRTAAIAFSRLAYCTRESLSGCRKANRLSINWLQIRGNCINSLLRKANSIGSSALRDTERGRQREKGRLTYTISFEEGSE